MAKPPPPPPSEGAPEWMVSFADLVTIMMAFFVVMYAMAPKKDSAEPEADLQKLLASVQQRFGPDYSPFRFGQHPVRTKKPKPGRSGIACEGAPTYLDHGQENAPQSRRASIRVLGRGDRLIAGSTIFFDENQVEPTEDEIRRLKALAVEMAGKPQKVQVLCHTSRRPLAAKSPYKDHWELAYARGRAVMKQLVADGIDPRRFRIAIAGGNEPTYVGMDEKLLAENSRVELYFLDAFTHELEAPAESAAAKHAAADAKVAEPDAHESNASPEK